jgi:ATP-dependent DNA helicase RecG
LNTKEGWNPIHLIRTVCAFANDFEKQGSGYIIIGTKERNGIAERPVIGFPINQFDEIQKKMISYGNLIRPAYFPRLYLEPVDGKNVLVIWVPAGGNRPYEVPVNVTAKKNKTYAYYIRRYSNSVQAGQVTIQELIRLTANIPFDDRINNQAKLSDIDVGLIREHLQEIKSKLFDESLKMPLEDLARQMNLAEGSSENIFPKNIGILMFNRNPDSFFPYVQIDVVEFPNGPEESEMYEKIFKGSIQRQLRDVLEYLKTNLIKEKIRKIPGKAESERFYNYPYEALEEALANAVYHRNYELREPIEVRILPESIEIISYGGPDPSIRLSDFNKGIIRARRYRNRRIGEFLKELRLTEGRATGIPTIKRVLANNGSPLPVFDTDGEKRTYFLIEILMHPDFRDQVRDQVEMLELALNINNLSELDQLIYGLNQKNWDQVRDQVRGQVGQKIWQVLNYCREARSRKEILNHIGLTNKSTNFKRHVDPIVEQNWIGMTIPEKRQSSKQQYILTERGKKLIDLMNI